LRGSDTRPPNIVFILADDLGWGDLGCYGNKFNESPSIDRLAGQGMRFRQFYAAAPVCSPTRASILSGQYPARFGLTAHIPGHWKPFERLVEPPNALALPREISTLAEELRSAGYATAHFGKWHLGGSRSGPDDHGFDTSFVHSGHSVPPALLGKGASAPRRTAEYLTERAVNFIKANTNRPFFLYLCHFAVHIPLDTTPRLERKYEKKPKVEGYSCNPLYAGLIEEMDVSVGAIMQELEDLRLNTNTIVVFTSDNGGLEREIGGWPGTSNHPLRSEKGSLYEGGLRVPLIVRWPNVVHEGAVTDAIGTSVDFFPTLLQAAGKLAPTNAILDGVTLMPVLRNATHVLRRDTIYWHYPHYHHSRPASALRQGDWKAIEFFDTGKLELYNLKADLSETNDLSEKFPDRAGMLRRELVQWRRAVEAQLPQVNPAYDPKRLDEWWSRANVAPTEAPGTIRRSQQ
jgi:uncharacterized sulfatase